jgi:hypothetical protein
MAAVGLLTAATLAIPPPDTSTLRPLPGVPMDVRALAARTWKRFTDALPGVGPCIPPVILDVAPRLSGRAEYRPHPPTIVLRVPAPAGTLEAALVHELAHHLEFACPDQAHIRRPFLQAQGFPEDSSWFHGERWETTPSEIFAEAVVQAVLGERVIHRRTPVRPAAVDLVVRWGSSPTVASREEP